MIKKDEWLPLKPQGSGLLFYFFQEVIRSFFCILPNDDDYYLLCFESSVSTVNEEYLGEVNTPLVSVPCLWVRLDTKLFVNISIAS